MKSADRQRAVRLAMAIGCLVLLAAGCSEESSKPYEPPDAGPFTLDDTTAVTLDLAPGASYHDAVTGMTLVFPAGASGRLTRGGIVEAPERPWEGGTGLYLSYDGEEPVWVKLPHAEGGCELVLCYTMPFGAWAGGIHERWLALPVADTLRSEAGDSLLVWLGTPESGAGEAGQGGAHHWIYSFAPGSAIADTLASASATARGLITAWLDSLSAPTRQACEARIAGGLAPGFYPDGLYYCGFARPGSGGRLPAARIGVGTAPTRGIIARELGYYFTHLLMGDDAYAALEAASPLDPGFGRYQFNRAGLINDYAYFHEYLLTGAIEGAGDPAAPATFFEPQMATPSPALVDVPALEGYGVLLLHALTRRNIAMVNLAGDPVTIAPVGMSYAELADEIIAAGATNMNELRTAASARLAARGMASRLQILAAATGWAYTASPLVTDTSSVAIAGATALNVLPIDEVPYQSSSMPSFSDAAGRFALHNLFPGESRLRVNVPGDTYDVHVSLDWSRATNSPVSLPRLVAWRNLDVLGKFEIDLDLTFDPDGAGELPVHRVVADLTLYDTAVVFEPDRIYRESPYTISPCTPGSPKDCWTVDSLRVEYSLETGEVEQLRFNLYNGRTDPPSALRVRLAGALYASMSGCNKVYFAKFDNARSSDLAGRLDVTARDANGIGYSGADLVDEGNKLELSAYRG
jgi:hypothetical protein